MPGANTSNLAKTTVGLTRKTGDTPTSNYAFIALTFSYPIISIISSFWKTASMGICFSKKTVSKINLLSNISTIHLNLHQMCFLLLKTLHLPDLCMS